MQETIQLHSLAASLDCDVEDLVREVRKGHDSAASPQTSVSMDVAEELRKKFESPPKPRAPDFNISQQTSESVSAPDEAESYHPDLGEFPDTEGPNVLNQDEIDSLLNGFGKS